MVRNKRSEDEAANWASLPDGDAERLVSACRQCLEEDTRRQAPRVSLMMLAIQQALETAPGHTKSFGLDAVFGQIRRIADGEGEVSAAVVAEARRARRTLKPESFFTGFISGKKRDERGKFNFYMRTASVKIGLDYEAAIGTVKSLGGLKYRLKRLPSAGTEGLKALIGAGAAVMATKGWASEEACGAYQEARELEEKLIGRQAALPPRLRAEVAIGLWSNCLIRGDLSVATAEAGRLLELAERSGDPDILTVAYRTLGTNALWLGDFVCAETYLRKCLEELARGPEYQPFAADLDASPYSFVCSDLADALWALGRYEEALKWARVACDHALDRAHYFHYCYSLTFSSWIHFKLGEFDAAGVEAATLLEWADRCGLAAFRALGRVLEGIIRAFQADDATEGIGRIYEGLGAWRAGGGELLVCYFFTDAAQAWLRCGHAYAAELELEKAHKAAEKTGEGYYKAEMHRLRGDIAWLRNKKFAKAEVSLGKALGIATAQQSKTFRLRAAMSFLKLARARTDLPARRKKQQVLKQQGELRAIHDAFDGGRDSADLREARLLLRAADVGPTPAR